MRLESEALSRAARDCDDSDNEGGYAALGEMAMQTEAWNTPTELPEPLRSHKPPVAEFLQAVESHLQAKEQQP